MYYHTDPTLNSDYLPEPPNVIMESSYGNPHDDFSVDTMLLDGHTLVCLHIDSQKLKVGSQGSRVSRLRPGVSFSEQVFPYDGQGFPFDGTGHFPILAGYDDTGEPLYVAAVCLEFLWYFTTVKDGQSTAVYSDEVGKTHIANEFFVLALRHNPSDLPPPYPRARKGAMDPTGPVFWLKFWPEKDPEYYKDARLVDDGPLKSFLDEFAADYVSVDRHILRGFD